MLRSLELYTYLEILKYVSCIFLFYLLYLPPPNLELTLPGLISQIPVVSAQNPGYKANAGTVSHGPTLQRKTLATQGCGRAVKFCLRPALNPHLGEENNCLLSSDASRTQEWKQHGGRRHSCFVLETPPPVRFFDPDPYVRWL